MAIQQLAAELWAAKSAMVNNDSVAIELGFWSEEVMAGWVMGLLDTVQPAKKMEKRRTLKVMRGPRTNIYFYIKYCY